MSEGKSNVVPLKKRKEKLNLGEPPLEINDRNEDVELAKWAARRRTAELAGDYY